MTTYYVSPNGSDANNGLGPDASHASNKPWLTIGKALGAAGIASGDTVYIAPGTYREVVTIGFTPAATTSVLGDPGNAQGFKDGSGNLLAKGEVQLTAYTTNDTTAPASSSLLTLNGKSFLSFQDILFVGGNAGGSAVTASTAGSHDISFTRCVFITGSNQQLMSFVGTFATAANWTFDRCIFGPSMNAVTFNINLPTGTGADYDANFVFKNCWFGAGSRIDISGTGALANTGGGVVFYNCHFQGGNSRSVFVSNATISTTIPCKVYDSWLGTASTAALAATTSGQIVEDYNYFFASVPRSNVTAGTHSQSGSPLAYAPLMDWGQSWLWGEGLRPYGSPMSGSGLSGYGSQAGAPSVDLLNRARPATYAIGPLERSVAYGGVGRSRVAGAV